MTGTRVPACAVEHQYFVTEKTDRFPAGLPTLRDPDGNFYVKPEPGALAVGGWETNTPPWGADGIRADFGPELLQPDFERFAPIAEAASGADSGAERSRHPADDQRPDPDHRRRRADHRPLARARQLLPLLRLHVRHRRVRRRRLGDGQLDRRRRSGNGPVAVRRAPLRRAALGQGVHVRAGRRELQPLLSHRVAGVRGRRRPRRAAQPVARRTEGRRRRLRQQVRLGAPELVRAAGNAGGRSAVVRARRRHSTRSAPSIARCASASR